MNSEFSTKYESILEAMSQAFLILDHDFKLTFANKKATALLDPEASTVQGQHLTELLDLSDDDLKSLAEATKNGETYASKTLRKHDDENWSEIRFRIKLVRIPLSSQSGFFIEIDDSNSPSITEEDLRRLGKKTGQLSHDISNPLAVLRIHCDNFALKAKKASNFSADDVLTRIKKLSSATDRLTDSNNELKSLSKALIDGEQEKLMKMIAAESDEKSDGGSDDFQH